MEFIVPTPVFINYSVGTKRFEKAPDDSDKKIIEKIGKIDDWPWFPAEKMMFTGVRWGDTWRAGYHTCVDSVDDFYTKRNLFIIAKILQRIEDEESYRLRMYLKSWFTSSQTRLHRMNRYAPQHKRHVGPMANTYYISSTPAEISPFYFFNSKIKDNCVESRKKKTTLQFNQHRGRINTKWCDQCIG